MPPPDVDRRQRCAYPVAAEELRGNAEQWQVYESRGHCVVLAGPGSGKTKTLTIKLARMLAEDVCPPRGLACITFNNECVRELARRLDKLGVSQSRNVFIGTMHHFCLANIVRPYGRMAGLDLPDPLRVAGSSDQSRSFDKAVKAVCGSAGGIKRPEMDRCRRTILDRQAADWHADGESVFRVIEAYERDLRAKGLVDFDDMILLGLRLVERHGWVRRLLKARFPVLVVDEYQDLGLPLHRIVSSLCFQAGVRLLAVGDPDQSIYGFTGAKPKLLRELAQWPDVDSVQLRMNYRCGTSIVRASEIVLGLESGRFGCPADAPEGTIEFHTYPDGIEEQARKICTEIIPMALERRKERKLGDVAVLYLDKNDGDKIATAAQGASFECIRIDRNAPYERTRLTRWLEDCAAWCVGGWREGEPRLSALINTWMGFNGRFGCSDGLTIELRRRLVRCLWEHRDTDLSLRVWLDALYSDCLQYTFDDRCESQDESEILKQLRRACAPGGKMANWTVAAFAGQGGSPTHLNLITLHSAKGREFEVVIMMGMDQGRIPWSNDKAKEKAEKRRLFYVGLTRAKREVHIVYSGWCSDRYGRPHCCGPSEFVKELRQRLAG